MIKKLTGFLVALVAAFTLSVPVNTGQFAALNIDRQGNITEQSEAVTYGWRWNEIVDVYDNTGGISPYASVAQATAEWERRSGIDTRMTTNVAEANIVVEFRDGICGSGCAYFAPVVNNIATGTCYATALPSIADIPAVEAVILHEIGHCVGLAHAPQTTRSVMTATISANDFYKAPQPYDYKDMKSLYGR